MKEICILMAGALLVAGCSSSGEGVIDGGDAGVAGFDAEAKSGASIDAEAKSGASVDAEAKSGASVDTGAGTEGDAAPSVEPDGTVFSTVDAGPWVPRPPEPGCAFSPFRTPPHATPVNDCADGFQDTGCLDQMLSCAEGESLIASKDGRCPSCFRRIHDVWCEVIDTSYGAFIERAISRSCADYCDTDDDCIVVSIDTACEKNCPVVLYEGTADSLLEAVREYHDHSCTECGDTPFAVRKETVPVHCVSHKCTADDLFAPLPTVSDIHPTIDRLELTINLDDGFLGSFLNQQIEIDMKEGQVQLDAEPVQALTQGEIEGIAKLLQSAAYHELHDCEERVGVDGAPYPPIIKVITGDTESVFGVSDRPCRLASDHGAGGNVIFCDVFERLGTLLEPLLPGVTPFICRDYW